MTSPTPRLDLFAACPPGLEAVAAAEFFALGFQPAHPVPGGVELRGTLAHLYRANLCSRVAGRILLRLGEFHATAFDELRRKAAQLPWEAFLRPGGLLAFNVSAHKSRLIHTGAIEQRLAEAIGERLGQPSPADRAGQLILARLDHDACTLSVDTSGAPLHRRGYRLATAKAPLRETLAAAILLGSGYPGPGQPPIATIGGCPPARESAPGPGPLVDPFCGAGTIAIEAALLARRIAPGLRRSFAFESFPGFDPELWARERARAQAAQLPAAPAPIVASDRDAGAIEAARANAERAGVAGDIEFSVRALSALQVPPGGPGRLVSNPPYGARVRASGDLRNLYAALGRLAREGLPGWQIALLAPHPALPAAAGLALRPTLSFQNGGIPVKLWQAVAPSAG